MYNVTANGRTAASESSYEKAVAAAKTTATNVANDLLCSASAVLNNSRLYRSPKARRNVAHAMSRQAMNIAAAAKFPKKSGDVAVRAGGVTIAIAKA
jgi:hypothetical protein